MTRKVFAGVLLLAVLAGCSEPGAYHYKVWGTVVDEAGKPIEGVEVVLSGFDLARVRQQKALTGADGRFVMKFDIDPFQWRQEAHWFFLFRKEGYKSRSLGYPWFGFDDRFRYQGYWYKVFFRHPVVLKREKAAEEKEGEGEESAAKAGETPSGGAR